MGKSDTVKLAELNAKETRFVTICDLVKHGFVCIVVGVLGYGVIQMLIVGLKTDPAHLTALAKCLAQWKLMDVLCILAASVSGGGWFYEHKRNQWLTASNGDLRRANESNDKVAPRSGLDNKGISPED